MSFAFFIRHGQASAHAEDYDQLSTLGYQQSRTLKQHLTSQQKVDAVWFGPKKRHRQTYETARLPDWPDGELKDWLDEFPAHEIMEYGIPILKHTHPHYTPQITALQNQVGTGSKEYLVILQILCDLWIHDQLVIPQIISGSTYLDTLCRGLEELKAPLREDKTILLFSSAGTIASLVGCALQACPKLSLRNAWAIYNASFSVMRLHDNDFMLAGFNWIDHIPKPDRTFV